MLDDLQRLRENPRLVELLDHYADLGKKDRSVWQQRLMEMEGIEPKELSRLHGELIAFDWIDQNTSTTSGSVLSGLYRITSHGIRDLCQIQGVVCPDRPEILEKASPKFPPRKRNPKAEAVENLEAISVLPPTSEVISPAMASTPA